MNQTGQTGDVCWSGKPCAPDHACTLQESTGLGTCTPRACGSACTLFHLEVVAEDDHEVVVFLHFDHAPAPVRVLDLYLTYPLGHLQPAEARPLAPLASRGKGVAAHVLPGGLYRVTVIDPDGSHPVPTGPIIELVFRRTGTCAPDPAKPADPGPDCRIAFSDDPFLLGKALAPAPGTPESLAALQETKWWGASEKIGARADSLVKLRLWYDMENVDAPIGFSNIPSAEDLCTRIPDCSNLSTEVELERTARERFLTRLARLQAGGISGGQAVPGVAAEGLYLNGADGSLRLPVVYEAPELVSTAPLENTPLGALDPHRQDLSWSAWFYADGTSAAEVKASPQVLFAHQQTNERSRYGVWLRKSTAAGAPLQLELFEGDGLGKPGQDTTNHVLMDNVPLRRWTHVAVTVAARSGLARVYVDGRARPPVQLTTPPSPFTCPRIFGSTALALQRQGDLPVGGRPPDAVFRSEKVSGRWRIVRSDGNGLDEDVLLSDGQYDFRDPDYQPSLDRLVFVSTESGAQEIWVSDANGGQRVQLTEGFGDSFLGFGARRPRWAPDGSAIVFDSNAFDVLSLDNHLFEVRHLYWIGWDPQSDQPAIASPSGGELDRLEYDALVLNGDIAFFRLTSAEIANHHMNARWLTGKRALPGGTQLGRLLYQRTSPLGDEAVIAELTVPQTTSLASTETLTVLSAGDPAPEARLVDARRHEQAATSPPAVERVLYAWSLSTYEPTTDLTTDASSCGGVVGDTCSINVRCNDCGAELRDVYISFDSDLWQLVPDQASLGLDAPGDSTLKVSERLPQQGGSYARVSLTRPGTSTLSGVVANVVFSLKQASPAAATIFPTRLTRTEALRMADLAVDGATAGMTFVGPHTISGGGRFDFVRDGSLSLELDEAVLLAYKDSRPYLLRTSVEAQTAAEAQPLNLTSRAISGLSWRHEERFAPCSVAGSLRHPIERLDRRALRGGLDELKVYTGLRSEASIRSEAERGREHLDALTCTHDEDCPGGRVCTSGQCRPPSGAPVCGSHADCPPYHVCRLGDGRCHIVPCDPSDPQACQSLQAQCSLRPIPVELEHEGSGGSTQDHDWVCATDCQIDSQCFSQACLNGPCRFCDQATLTCIECRDDTGEGFPDPQTFRCEAGTCISDCYELQDEQSTYLCDQSTEFCEGGRCVARDFDWPDFAPASLSGLSPMQRNIPGWRYTQVVDQRNAIQVKAWGQPGYGFDPEVLVEVKGTFYPEWSVAGSFVVSNENPTEAAVHPYSLSTSFPFDAIRLRLVAPANQNPAGGPTGLGGGINPPSNAIIQNCAFQAGQTGGDSTARAQAMTACLGRAGAFQGHDGPFCLSDRVASALVGTYAHNPADLVVPTQNAFATALTACAGATFEGMHSAGYPVGIPPADVAAACEGPACPLLGANDPGRADLPFGGRGVIITSLEVDGAERIAAGTKTNSICTTVDDAGAAIVNAPNSPLFLEKCRPASNACCTAGAGCTDLICRGALCAADQRYCDAAATWDNAAVDCAAGTGSLPGVACADVAEACGCGQAGPWAGDPGLCGQGVTHTVSKAYGLLNCTHPDAHLMITALGEATQPDVIIEGAVTEGPLGCVVEKSETLLVPCIAIEGSGGDASGDPAASLAVLSGTLDMLLFRSFGWDGCGPDCSSESTGAGLSVILTEGALPAGLTVVFNQQHEVGFLDGVATLPSNVPVGHPYSAALGNVPAGFTCQLSGSTGLMQATGAEILLTCAQNHALGAVLSGLGSGASLTLQVVTTAPGGLGIKRNVTLAANGAFPLVDDLAAGTPYQVTVAVPPAGQSCSVASATGTFGAVDLTLPITCTDQPSVALSLEASGLAAGETVDVTEQLTGATAQLTATSGPVSLATLPSGTAYQLIVSAQPTASVCSFCNGASCGQGTSSGTLSGSGTQTVSLSCVAKPTQELTVQVIGLTQPGLALEVLTNVSLGQTTGTNQSPGTVAPPQGFGQPVELGPFEVSQGLGYRVTVTDQPDGQTCQAVAGQGVISTQDHQVVVSCATENNLPGYLVGVASITGLGSSHGLELVLRDTALDTNISFSQVPAGSTAFGFEDAPLAAGTSWEVLVGKQPTNPPLRCTVHGVGGTVIDQEQLAGSIACVPAATLTVSVDLPENTGAGVVAWLLDSNGKRVGTAADGTKLSTSGSTFTLRQVEDGPVQGGEPSAHVLAGTYTLAVMVNKNGNTSPTGGALIDGGDLGLLTTVVLGNAAATRSIGPSELVPLNAAWSKPVKGNGNAALADGEDVQCWWYPRNPNDSYPFPPGPIDGALGLSTAKGTASADPDLSLAYLPHGNWRVRCWLDNDLGPGVGPNGVLDSNDLAGSVDVTLNQGSDVVHLVQLQAVTP